MFKSSIDYFFVISNYIIKPCDRGLINGKPVLNVTRVGAEAVHFVQSDEPFAIGDEAQQQVDWERRFDHMQQHSGLH